jgi:hypothetical protein
MVGLAVARRTAADPFERNWVASGLGEEKMAKIPGELDRRAGRHRPCSGLEIHVDSTP